MPKIVKQLEFWQIGEKTPYNCELCLVVRGDNDPLRAIFYIDGWTWHFTGENGCTPILDTDWWASLEEIGDLNAED